MKRVSLMIILVFLLSLAASAAPVQTGDIADLATDDEWAVVRAINEARMEEGLLPLALAAELQSAAITRVTEVNTGYVARRPDATPPDTLAGEIDLIFDSFGQLYAIDCPDPEVLVSTLLSLESYAAYLLDPAYTQIGAAIADETWVIVFTGTSAADSIELLATAGTNTFACGTGISDMGLYAVLTASGGETSAFPVTAGMVSGYQSDQAGSQTLTVRYGTLSATIGIVLEGDEEEEEPEAPGEPEESEDPESPVTVLPATTFNDVGEGDWFYSAVSFVQSEGLFTGDGAGNFAPQVKMSRGMFVTVMAKLAVRLGEDISGGEATFPDVPSNEWYYQSVCWAASTGLVEGMGDGTFGANVNISREQMCMLFVKFARAYDLDLTETAGTPPCTDYDSVSGWAKQAVAISYESGLVTGFDDNTFRPQEIASRAEVASLFQKFVSWYMS